MAAVAWNSTICRPIRLKPGTSRKILGTRLILPIYTGFFAMGPLQENLQSGQS